MIAVVRHELATIEQKLAAPKHNITPAMHNLTVAMHEAANAQHNAIVSATTGLYNLATDCLRLSMHFFHPIQQCAQQVYHSALPLSPTSSPLRKYYLQSFTGEQLSRVTVFSGAPDTWGSLLRTINISPRQLTCIATSVQNIIAACGGAVNIYDAVTGALRQSLHTSEVVTKIQGSPDGSILFFAHSSSATMWDVQTGGLIHTFTTRPEINDIAVSTTGNHLACGSSDGSVAFWDIHTKEEGKGFGDGRPVVAIHWMSAMELAVATRNSLYVRDVAVGKTSNSFPTPGPVWGMVYLADRREFVIGTSRRGGEADQESFTIEPIGYALGRLHQQPGAPSRWQSLAHPGSLAHPVLLGKDILCITPPRGVKPFNTESHDWTNSPPLLDVAASTAVLLNGNLVVQTEDSIQIFSADVLTSGEVRKNVHSSHIYPLGEKHIVRLLQPDRRVALLELETSRELRPGDDTSPLRPLLTNQSPPGGLVAEFGTSVVVEAWQSDNPLPRRTEAAEEDVSLSGLSPKCTRIAAIYGSPQRELRVKDAEGGTTLAKLSLEEDGLGAGEVYDVTFDSETRFYLKIDGPGRHVQIPHDIIASPSGHTITRGEPVPLPGPRVMPPYSLDQNCEWVIDAAARKICWIPSGNIRKGNGGHFWAGPSLVMAGDDGVVRKLTFEEPDR